MADLAFSERFRQARGTRTIDSLAEQIGVTSRVVQKWQAGTTLPGGRNLVRLAEALGREPAWFFEDEENVAA